MGYHKMKKIDPLRSIFFIGFQSCNLEFSYLDFNFFLTATSWNASTISPSMISL